MRLNHFQWIIYSALSAACPLLFIAVSPANGQMSWGDRSFDTTTQSGGDRRWDGNNGWLGSSSVNKGWRLGVRADNTDAGVIVRQVTPDSPAARAGMSAGDVIVCIAGDQVGRVGNQIYDLGEEINHHADSSGRIMMLVQFRQTGQLRPLQVQLTDQRGGLSGTLSFRNGTLPQNSIVTVRLENVSRPHYAVRNGQYSFRLTSFNQGNIPFELNYDPNYISRNDTYRVRAYVTSGGVTVFDTQQPPFVLTKGYPNSVRLVLGPSSYSPGGDYSIAGNYPPSGGVITAGYRPVDSYSQEIASAYRRYLGRSPSSVEFAAWYQTPDIAYRMQRLPLELMATQEFYDLMGANEYAWVQRVFNEIVGKAPSSHEMNLWTGRFAELRYSRTELLNQLQMQVRR